MDLRHLRTFVTVAEHGTVSKASELLAVAQPALSRQIGDLEAELGIKLFDRIRRRDEISRGAGGTVADTER
jgi:DNA-binding transcriptional LysR family regulator